MSEWKNYCIGDLCSTISNTYNGSDDKVVLINTSDVLDGKVLNHNFVENKNLKGQFKKTFIKNDILYSEIRPANKRFAFIDFDKTNNYIVSTKLMVLRPDTTKVLPSFLFSILKSQTVIDELQHLAETRSGTFPQITFSSELAPMKVLLPNLDIQAKIVSILNSIEEKISTNTAINNNLEQQIFTIFDNKFPNVRDGKNTISDYFSPKRGKNLLLKNAVLGDVPVIAGGLNPATYHNVANTKAPVITISASGANAGFVNLWHIPVWSSDSSYIDNTITSNIYFWYVMLKKRQQEIFDSQTGSAQPHIYPQHIEGMTVSDIDMNLVNDFNDNVTPLFINIGENIKENQKLIQLCDTLLPKLMSGEIDVSEVDISTDKLLFRKDK